MKTKLSPLLFLFLFSTITLAQTKTWFVSSDGNDANTGSIQQPFRTIQKAVDVVRQQSDNASQRIIIRGGKYMLEQEIRIRQLRTISLSIEAQEGESVVITGNKAITGKWEKVGKNLWKIKTSGKFNQLFVDGLRAIRARFPNQGEWIEPEVVELNKNRIVFNKELPQTFAGIRNAELHTTGFWHFIRQSIKSFNPDEKSIITNQAPGPECSSRKIEKHDRAHFENSLLFVDTENEWFLDKDKGELYFQTSKDPNRMNFEYPALTTLLRVEGTPDQAIKDFRLKGIEFSGTEWEMTAVERKGIQAGFWGTEKGKPVYAPVAAVMLDRVTHSQIEGCRFRLLGEGAITLESGSSFNQIVGNLFEDVGSNVIQIGYRHSYIGEGHPLHLDFEDPTEVSHHNLVRNNHFKNFATTDLGGVGIWVGYSHNNLIEHNLLEDFPYSGISVGWYWGNETDPVATNCHSNTIAWNELRNGMQYLSDGAAIYLVGNQPGSRVVDNWIHDIGGGFAINAGIYIDEGGANIEIARNYVDKLVYPDPINRIKLHKNVIPTMLIYHNGGDNTINSVVTPSDRYPASKYAEMSLGAPLIPGRYGLQEQ